MMSNHGERSERGERSNRKKKSDKAKITRQKNGPYSTRSARITTAVIEKKEDPEEKYKGKR